MSTTRGTRRSGSRRIWGAVVAALCLVVPLSAPALAAKPPPKPPSTSPATLTAVAALSRHRVLATFDRQPDATQLVASYYGFATATGINLPALAVTAVGANQALISTTAQEAVTYQVTKPVTGSPKKGNKPAVPPLSFAGSLDVEPALQSAQSLSSTQVLLRFSEPIGVSGDQAAAYTVTSGGTPLAVTSAQRFGDYSQVLLTTAPQATVTYTVTVGDIAGISGEYLDPTANSAQLVGTTSSVAPLLLGAVPQGETGVLLKFDTVLDPEWATDLASYSATPDLFIGGASLQPNGTDVLLSTGVQYQVTYTVTAAFVDAEGEPISSQLSSASWMGSRPMDAERPKVVSAASLDNKTVVVQFSKPMADSTPDPSHFVIVQTNVNPEVGTVLIKSAAWNGTDRLSVRLTTLSQAEVTYQVTANNVVDLLGQPLADRQIVQGVLVDPTSFTFPGTPPTGTDRVDTDGDGIYDHEETRGWEVTVQLANGETAVRQVTSSPESDDTDQDGLTDYQDRSLNIDPRDSDTDDDGLDDYAEFNEIFSDPTIQDSDGDTLFDGLEVTFFRTSAILDDTDGDQILDGVEIGLANRNPVVADLAKPALELGSMTMGLDVRFVDTVGTTRTEVDSKTATATLTQSNRQEFSNSDGATIEAGLKLGVRQETAVEAGTTGIGVSAEFETTHERSVTAAYTTSFTETSSEETTEQWEESLTTSEERSENATQSREVFGARVSASVMLKSAGDIAFTIRNLQVTAHIQDPQDPTKLIPIGTLLPEGDPATAFTLGPLVPAKGPVVFSSDTVFPALVEDLMRNPRGVVLRFSNYDITDERGRNYAFTSQDVNDRTARVAIDYGGTDRDGDGEGDHTDVLLVATGTGRRVVDTDGDGDVDEDDRILVFDANGGHVGITLRDALLSAGLTQYDESERPSSTLTPAELEGSYSVMTMPNGDERVFRIRRTQRELPETGAAKEWQIITATGIDRSLGLDDIILTSGQSVTLSFVQDLDRDNLTAAVERVNNCSDGEKDSDSDGLDDRFEVLIGWTVDTDRGQFDVRSRCASTDTDNDGITDLAEAPGVIERVDGMVDFSPGHAPRRYTGQTSFTVDGEAAMLALPATQGDLAQRTDFVPARLFLQLANTPTETASWVQLSEMLWTEDTYSLFVRPRLVDPITDPSSQDTDGDGLDDLHEATPHVVDLYDGAQTEALITSAELFDTDIDTASDGLEERVGGDPTVRDLDNFLDSDGDGLSNIEETEGWEVYTEAVSEIGFSSVRCDSVCLGGNFGPETKTSNPNIKDTDGDGLTDGEEKHAFTGLGHLGIDPRDDDTDGDGLTDFEEVRGYDHGDFGILSTSPADADSDNDKRTDGAEVEQALIVRPPGKAPFAVLTDPTVADGDLDRLVDGDEAAAGTDPTNFNTDGDNRPDYDEVALLRNPLLPDLRVSLNFARLVITEDGEDGGDEGDLDFKLTVTSPTVNKTVVHSQPVSTDDANPLPLSVCGAPPCFRSFAGHPTVIQVDAGQTIDFGVGGRSVDVGSVSTTSAVPQEIRIGGYVLERDGATHDSIDCRVDFPDPFASAADRTGIIAGSSLQPGTNSIALHRKVTCNETLHTLEFTLMVSYTAT